ncbi:MAG: glycosyltransferase family 39 protein [Lachnospiraceae bacterium]|nr:glycosyltransferase family 39 protein [Lachnospiraceae bacterium]
MKKEECSKKRVYIILTIMICIQLISIICYFQFWKEGYHSDEIWSYGFANSYNLKDIYQDNQGNLLYINEWSNAQVLNDYIVVNDGERFQYGSIYNNQIVDLSPPFHSMVLHTICSFFPEQYSRWFSFSINIVSFLVTMIFLFKTAKLLKNDVFALCCCALYGFSMGARDTHVYLRMYAMCTALIMIILYNILRYLQKYKENHKLLQFNLIAIGVASLIGFLTHYYVVSFMGILTFCICAFFLFKREYKLTFGFGFFMLAIFILSVSIFPAMFQVTENKISTEASYTDYNFTMRFLILSHYMMKKMFNISISMYASATVPIVLGVLVFLLIVCIPLFYLLRDTVGMKKFVKYNKIVFLHPCRTWRYLMRRTNWVYILLFATIIGQMFVVGETSYVYAMGPAIDRYLFYVFPILAIIGMALIYQLSLIIFKKKKRSQIILLIACIVLVGVNCYNCTLPGIYAFKRQGNAKFEDIVKNENCIYVTNSSWVLTTMVPTLMYADMFSLVDYREYENVKALYEEKKDEGVIVILDASLKQSAEQEYTVDDWKVILQQADSEEVIRQYEEIIAFLEDLEPETEMKHLDTQYIQNMQMEVYLVNP